MKKSGGNTWAECCEGGCTWQVRQRAGKRGSKGWAEREERKGCHAPRRAAPKQRSIRANKPRDVLLYTFSFTARAVVHLTNIPRPSSPSPTPLLWRGESFRVDKAQLHSPADSRSLPHQATAGNRLSTASAHHETKADEGVHDTACIMVRIDVLGDGSVARVPTLGAHEGEVATLLQAADSLALAIIDVVTHGWGRQGSALLTIAATPSRCPAGPVRRAKSSALPVSDSRARLPQREVAVEEEREGGERRGWPRLLLACAE